VRAPPGSGAAWASPCSRSSSPPPSRHGERRRGRGGDARPGGRNAGPGAMGLRGGGLEARVRTWAGSHGVLGSGRRSGLGRGWIGLKGMYSVASRCDGNPFLHTLIVCKICCPSVGKGIGYPFLCMQNLLPGCWKRNWLCTMLDGCHFCFCTFLLKLV
jgi:hypothetical protein